MLKMLNELLEAVRAIDEELEIPQDSVRIHGGSKLEEIEEFMDSNGIIYWLYDEPKVNPDRDYELWIRREDHYGGSPTFTWGLSKV